MFRVFLLLIALIATFPFVDARAERFPGPNIGEDLSEDFANAYRWLSRAKPEIFSRSKEVMYMFDDINVKHTFYFYVTRRLMFAMDNTITASEKEKLDKAELNLVKAIAKNPRFSGRTMTTKMRIEVMGSIRKFAQTPLAEQIVQIHLLKDLQSFTK